MPTGFLGFIMRKNWKFYKYYRFTFMRKNSHHAGITQHRSATLLLFSRDQRGS